MLRPDAIPPAAVPEATAGAVASDRLTLASADGAEVGAFLARPERPSGVAGADEGIPPEQVAAFDQALTAAGLEHELVSYPGAPHSFFDVAHAEHADASADAWRRVPAFIGRRTGGWD